MGLQIGAVQGSADIFGLGMPRAGFLTSHEAHSAHRTPEKCHVACRKDASEVQAIADSPHVLVLRDRDTVDSLSQRLRHARRIAVVGNGGIAMELVFNLCGVEVRRSQEHCPSVRHPLYPGKKSLHVRLGYAELS